MANSYNQAFDEINSIKTPKVNKNSEHVYHQYTLRILDNKRDELKSYLNDKGIPSMIYYPIPIHKQRPYLSRQYLKNTDILCEQVISLPVHTELESSAQDYIIKSVKEFFND